MCDQPLPAMAALLMLPAGVGEKAGQEFRESANVYHKRRFAASRFTPVHRLTGQRPSAPVCRSEAPHGILGVLHAAVMRRTTAPTSRYTSSLVKRRIWRPR